jgi:hypothetical protein
MLHFPNLLAYRTSHLIICLLDSLIGVSIYISEDSGALWSSLVNAELESVQESSAFRVREWMPVLRLALLSSRTLKEAEHVWASVSSFIKRLKDMISRIFYSSSILFSDLFLCYKDTCLGVVGVVSKVCCLHDFQAYNASHLSSTPCSSS